ncbi:hypothetical protein VUR80DRAFT_6893 [Thermomyces stellatus]
MSNTATTPQRPVSPPESVTDEDAPTRTAGQILNAQHLRLLIYLLPTIQTISEFEAWLQRPPVLAAWTEFTAALSGLQPDPDLGMITPMVRAALDQDTLPHARFRMLHPDKRDWNATDHHVRFIVAVISDSLLEEHWDENEWNKHPARIVRAVYEVLVYMKAVRNVETVQIVD